MHDVMNQEEDVQLTGPGQMITLICGYIFIYYRSSYSEQSNLC